MSSLNLILDTNVLVSYILPSSSDLLKKGVEVIIQDHCILFSDLTFEELTSVLARRKFSRYISEGDRMAFLLGLQRMADFVDTTHFTQVCRDEKDNKFLDVALSGHADCIVTGDDDLLVLNPFQGIPILGPKQFLEALQTDLFE